MRRGAVVAIVLALLLPECQAPSSIATHVHLNGLSKVWVSVTEAGGSGKVVSDSTIQAEIEAILRGGGLALGTPKDAQLYVLIGTEVSAVIPGVVALSVDFRLQEDAVLSRPPRWALNRGATTWHGDSLRLVHSEDVRGNALNAARGIAMDFVADWSAAGRAKEVK